MIFSLGVLIISLLSYKACAQPGNKPLDGCELLQIEHHITKLESEIKKTHQQICRLNKSTAPNDCSNKKGPNVWAVYTETIRPSGLEFKQGCKNYSNTKMQRALEITENTALTDYENAKKELEEIRKKRPEGNKDEESAAEKEDSDTLGMPINITIPTGKSYVSEIITYQNGQQYTCFIVNPKSKSISIDFLWRDNTNRPLGNFNNAINYLKTEDKKTIMLMNAGIFRDKLTPLGLFYSNGKELCKFNNKDGQGNFYLQPSGIFIIKKDGTPIIKERKQFALQPIETYDIRHATQSGPMLVIDGKIHPEFNKHSNNFTTRNGVGIMDDGNIVFVLSDQPVNFYEFAILFRDGFGCKNALYLDGTISQMYLPEKNLTDKWSQFAGIIAISTKKTAK